MDKPVMKAPAGETFEKQLPPEGMVNAKCYAVVDLGSQENEWKWVKKLQRQIQISFETDVMWDFGDKWQLPLWVWETFSFFITETSNLGKMLEQRLGAIPDPNNFNIFDLVGKTAELMILHKTSKAGKTRAKIMAVKPGKKDWELINKPVMFTLDAFNEEEFFKLPARQQKVVQNTPEYEKILEQMEGTNPAETKAKDDGSDLPF